MYVSEHFQEAAKEGMLEMVGDIRAEFKKILNEVMNPDSRENQWLLSFPAKKCPYCYLHIQH